MRGSTVNAVEEDTYQHTFFYERKISFINTKTANIYMRERDC